MVRTDDLEDGDILVTAAASGTYPKGLRIGRATKVTDSRAGLFRTADLVPAVDFDTLEDVQIVVGNVPSAAITQPVSALPE